MVLAWKVHRGSRLVIMPLAVVQGLLGIQIGLGAILSKSLADLGSILHLALSLFILALILVPLIVLFYLRIHPSTPTSSLATKRSLESLESRRE